MEKIISKELLSEVLGKQVEIRGFKDKHIPANFEYIQDMIDVRNINIYELAHKCKEWAFKKGYELRTSINGIIDVYDHIYIHKEDGLTGEFIDCRQEADTEPEAIFKACEWILDNKKEIKC